MSVDEIRAKSAEELRELNRELRDELFRLRMKHAAGHLDKPARIRDVRRTVARVETVIRERA